VAHPNPEGVIGFYQTTPVAEGWRLVKTAYDDGGLSVATMARPALRRLLSDINQSLINVVVVYKVDRLTRSLSDFAKMVDGQILSDRTAITPAAEAIGLADNRLPSLFSAAAAWRERPQSEVEAGAALKALVDRVDLINTGIRVSLKVPIPDPGTRPAANGHELIITR
jgi:resolvase-like protein